MVELLLEAGANPDLQDKVSTQQDSGIHSNLSDVDGMHFMHLVKPEPSYYCLYAYDPDSTLSIPHK